MTHLLMTIRIKYLAVLLFFALSLTDASFAGTWIQKSDHGGVARHRAFGFSIGGRGYTGLGHVNSGGTVNYKDIWEYDPSTDTWTQKADFGGDERYHCTAFVIGNYGYVGMGHDNLDLYRTDMWRFDPIANTWTAISNFPGEERRGAAAFVIDGIGFVGTGQATSGYKDDFFKYDPQSDTWVPIANFPGSPRSGAVSFSHNGIGYIGTGHEFGNATKDFYAYDPLTNVWTQKADIGDTLRQDAAGFVLDGKGYLGTGNDVDGNFNYDDMWLYDFDLDTWTQIEDFEGMSRRYAFTFVIGSAAYLGGGTNGTNFKDLWVYHPYLSDDQLIQSDINFKAFPNPASNVICIDLEDKHEGTLDIFNMSGRLVLQSELTGHTKIDLSGVSSGTYLMRVKTDMGSQVKTIHVQ